VERSCKQFGAIFNRNFTSKVTHLVAKSLVSEKATAAIKLKIPIVSMDWILFIEENQLSEQEALNVASFKLDCPQIFPKGAEGASNMARWISV
jgi:hypothetical protein